LNQFFLQWEWEYDGLFFYITDNGKEGNARRGSRNSAEMNFAL
jgi:hypothetical protein